jgi:general stress protein YciG
VLIVLPESATARGAASHAFCFSSALTNQENTMARGFASLNQDRRREISSKGGKVAHARGTAHEWSHEEAREAGRKGAVARRKKTPSNPTRAAGNRNNTLRGTPVVR